MFDPEYLDITCPGCHQREVYVDREMGFYCIFCGRQFSGHEIQLIIDAETRHAPDPSASSGGTPAANLGYQPWHRIRTRLGHALKRLLFRSAHIR